MKSDNRGVLALFSHHRVAANLLMCLLILLGCWALKQLNTQFFPSFERDVISISIVWSGASAEDVQTGLSIPVEQALQAVNGIENLYVTSAPGVSSHRLELEQGADLTRMLSEVKQAVDGVRDLPDASEEPVIQAVVRYESVARVLVSGPETLSELRPLVQLLEQELLDQGIRKVSFKGLPDEELQVQIAAAELYALGLSLDQVAARIGGQSIDLPAGTAGRSEGGRQVRSLGQAREVSDFEQLPLAAADGRLLRLGDVASIRLQPSDEQATLSYQGKPAVELNLQRTEADDTLEMAGILSAWQADVEPRLPQGVELVVYQERWTYLKDRIDLLLKNGVGGLILVIGALFLFLNVRVAFWVAMGIPVSFLTALAVLWLLGGSINLISLFGLILTLGIIVDDAIVVGENTLARVQQGEGVDRAALSGARKMLAPVLASSLTTIAAFLPLLMLQGNVGNILIDIPTVVICVLIASLVECFLILPGHLNHSLKKHRTPGQWRQRLDSLFEQFREHRFRRWVRLSLQHSGVTILAAVCLFTLSISLLMSGHLRFTFFPTIDGETVRASVQFANGTPRSDVDAFLDQLEEALYRAQKELDAPFVKTVVQQHRQAQFSDFSGSNTVADEQGALQVELLPSDLRPYNNAAILRAWQAQIEWPLGLEKFSLAQSKAGPPGKALELKLIGSDTNQLKAAALRLQEQLRGYVGVSNVEDDLPFGREQLIYRLTPTGEALGLSLEQVGRQLRAALEGVRVQIFYQEDQEVEVRLSLPDAERDYLSQLEQLPLLMPDGRTVLFENAVRFEYRPGIDRLQRVDRQQAVVVNADVDEAVGNANAIMSELWQEFLPQLEQRYGLKVALEGRSQEQQEMLADLRWGLVLALGLIYLILAWVFSSYSWPLVVMLVIPLGITGALLGHWFTGQGLTIMSLFGLFGLSGIVINDSIVLISFYQGLRKQGEALQKAIENAVCQRLRAVLLTSITTVCGLLPILFETSLQAQFLIPMATAIVFGLLFATVLILFVVPALLLILERWRYRFDPRAAEFKQ